MTSLSDLPSILVVSSKKVFFFASMSWAWTARDCSVSGARRLGALELDAVGVLELGAEDVVW